MGNINSNKEKKIKSVNEFGYSYKWGIIPQYSREKKLYGQKFDSSKYSENKNTDETMKTLYGIF
jgi:hypothetical protein